MLLGALAFGVFGLIIGSFLNVVILRYRERDLSGRSACMSCGARIRWYDLIPVFSWIALRGRCRACGARILAQYPIVEALTGILFASLGLAFLPRFASDPAITGIQVLVSFSIIGFLIAIAVYDIRNTIIPDPWVYSFAALGLVFHTLATPMWYLHVITIIGSGLLVALPLYLLWYFSGGTWMGFGDVKFALGMGWLLGMANGFLALFGGFILGALVSIPLLFFSSEIGKKTSSFLWGKVSPGREMRFTMKSEVPFGPFLIASTLLVWFAALYGVQITLFT